MISKRYGHSIRQVSLRKILLHRVLDRYLIRQTEIWADKIVSSLEFASVQCLRKRSQLKILIKNIQKLSKR